MNKYDTLGVSSALALSSLFGNDKNNHLKEKKKKAIRKKTKIAKASRKKNRK